jgi:hypothetical protein
MSEIKISNAKDKIQIDINYPTEKNIKYNIVKRCNSIVDNSYKIGTNNPNTKQLFTCRAEADILEHISKTAKELRISKGSVIELYTNMIRNYFTEPQIKSEAIIMDFVDRRCKN